MKFFRNKILVFFDSINLIKFFSKKRRFNFFHKKLRSIYCELLAKKDLTPIIKVKKVFKTNNINCDIFIDTSDFSNIAQVIDPDWEMELFDYYKKIKEDKLFFIDLGGNIGCHSLFFLKYVKFEKIIYVEPNPKCFELFKNSLSIQNLPNLNNVLAVNKAISETSGETSLKFFNHNSGSGSVVNYFGIKEKHKIMDKHSSLFNHVKCKNITFEEIFSDIPTDHKIIIKMDIQGYEPKILLHLSDLIKKFNISHCFFEVNKIDETILVEAIQKFGKNYLLKDLKGNIISPNNVQQYLKKVILLEKNN